jgi:acetyltransferase-like isoleucine patch superfamily enzyme
MTQICKTKEELLSVKENRIIGAETAELTNSDIRFTGTGNILVLGDGVRLQNTTIQFGGSNSIVYLSPSKHIYKLNLSLYNNSVFFCGYDNYMNGVLNVTISEQKHVFFGNNNLFAFGIWVRTADPHLIYSVSNKKRINPSKSVYLGDHVWTGQGAMVLKGTKIASGSILGAMSVCAGKSIPSNTSWAGNPARQLGEGIFWDNPCVHAYDDEKTKAHEKFKTDKYIYTYDKKEYISFDELERQFDNRDTDRKLEFIEKIAQNENKNRFAYSEKKGFLSALR